MKLYIAIFALFFISTSVADELIQMDNGMNCFRNKSGYTYGCNGGVDNGSGGFNDVKTGTRYNYINPNQALDTRTGIPMNTPPRNTSNKNPYTGRAHKNDPKTQSEYNSKSSSWKKRHGSNEKYRKFQKSSGSGGVSSRRKSLNDRVKTTRKNMNNGSSKTGVIAGSYTPAFSNSGSTLHEKMRSKSDKKFGNTRIFNCDGVFTDRPCKRFDNTFK